MTTPFLPKAKVAFAIVTLTMAGALPGAEWDKNQCAVSSDTDKFTLGILPDTQYYSKRDPETYIAQTKFLASSAGNRNTKFVLHMGDVTHKNTLVEWLVALTAHKELVDAKVPFTILPGNHDYPRDDGWLRRSPDLFNTIFGVGSTLFQTYWSVPPASPQLNPGGKSVENTYSTFDHGAQGYVLLNLEYAPRKDAVCWADGILKANTQRRAIISTHCYQDKRGKQYQGCTLDTNTTVGAHGAVLWRELINRHPNVFMVVSGHITGTEIVRRNRDSEAKGRNWCPVYEVLTDYQNEPLVTGGEKHGRGFLRLMEFLPSQSKISSRVCTVLSNQGQFSLDNVYRSKDPSKVPHVFNAYFPMQDKGSAAGKPLPPLNRFFDRTVNAASGGNQTHPRTAMDSQGNWVAAWEHSNDRIAVRGFSMNGCERFSQRFVSTAGEKAERPWVASSGAGEFAVVWRTVHSGLKDLSRKLHIRRFASDGAPGASIVLRSQPLHKSLGTPVVAMSDDGKNVVAWSEDNDAGRSVIQVRTFDFGGILVGSATIQTPSGHNESPAVSMRGDGAFALAWKRTVGDSTTVRASVRNFNASPVSAALTDINVGSVNEELETAIGDLDMGSALSRPSVAMRSDASFVVAWDTLASGSQLNINVVGKGIIANGSTEFGPTVLSQSATNTQKAPDIIAMLDGKFVATWTDDTDGNDWYQIRSRVFTRQGAGSTEETVNFNSAGHQRRAVVAGNSNRRFVVAWEDDLNKNGSWEVLARGCYLGDTGVPCNDEFAEDPVSFGTAGASAVYPVTKDDLMDQKPWASCVRTL